jgi:hypothetical protein
VSKSGPSVLFLSLGGAEEGVGVGVVVVVVVYGSRLEIY